MATAFLIRREALPDHGKSRGRKVWFVTLCKVWFAYFVKSARFPPKFADIFGCLAQLQRAKQVNLYLLADSPLLITPIVVLWWSLTKKKRAMTSSCWGIMGLSEKNVHIYTM